ncbi:MAG: TatD family hydrolase [Syntrophaceae bacterium]|nr:TatD family hydrolase [Syntrophaceae bacterium]
MEEIVLIDAHAHLEELEDLSDALSEAKSSGVKAIVAVGMDLSSNKKTLEIAQRTRGFVFPAIGYHPWKLKENEVEENLSFIKNHIQECIALGEIGLDYKVYVKKELQWKVFGEILDLAAEYDKLVILHCRFSHKRTYEMVMERAIKKAVFHWYSGPLDLLEKILAGGYFISATPALAYSPLHQQAIKKTPLERILLETDTPVSYQEKESRPKDVRISLKQVVRLKELAPLVVAKQTTTNATHFFQIG